MNRVAWRIVAGLMLSVAGCDDESGDRSMSMPKRGEPAPQPAASASQPVAKLTPQPALAPEAKEALRSFVTALSAGDREEAAKLFMPRDVFEKTFATDNLDAYYASLKQSFDESLASTIDGLKGAKAVDAQMESDPQPGKLPSGSHVGEARLTRDTTVLNDLSVIVESDEDPSKEVAVHVERLIQTEQGWFAIDPIEVGPRLRRQK
jgi:hypothetical protein